MAFETCLYQQPNDFIQYHFVLFFRNVEDIDLFPGGTAEKPLEDGTVGPTFACIIGYQFRAARKGDRFWHENPPPFGMFTKGRMHLTNFVVYFLF